MIAPMLVPALKRPVAKARSRLGNHSATAFRPAGKLPPSPTPSSIRAAMKPETERTAAWVVLAGGPDQEGDGVAGLAPFQSTNRPNLR